MDEATERYFRGRWQMVRIIENIPEGVIGEFWGEAVFEPDGQGLACREVGVLRFRGADYHAERASLWRFPDGGRVEVRYADGRPFHDFATVDPIAEHACGEDHYRVAYDFGRDSWTSRWEVTGPLKDYQMSTRYRRIPAGAPRPAPLPPERTTAGGGTWGEAGAGGSAGGPPEDWRPDPPSGGGPGRGAPAGAGTGGAGTGGGGNGTVIPFPPRPRRR